MDLCGDLWDPLAAKAFSGRGSPDLPAATVATTIVSPSETELAARDLLHKGTVGAHADLPAHIDPQVCPCSSHNNLRPEGIILLLTGC